MFSSVKCHLRKTILGLLASTCAGTASAQPVQVSSAWARATAPGQDTGAVYLTLKSAPGDTLTGVASQDAKSAMLHQTTRSGSMSGMNDMAKLPVPPGNSVTLSPGGGHIMLMDLKHPLVAGSHIGLDLTFARAGVVHVTVPVQPIRASGPPTQARP